MAFQETLLGLLPSAVKTFLEGSSRRDLLHKVNASLLVFDNRVCHLETGTMVEFQAHTGAMDVSQLAAASARLLGESTAPHSILLLLPPAVFVATRQTLPGINRDSLVSALSLQADSLLPANDSPLSLAVNSKALDLTDTPVALWTRNDLLVEYFNAFAAEGLFVAAIKPRVLNIEPTSAVVLDADATSLTLIRSQQDAVLQWMQIDRADLADEEFNQQWQSAITNEIRLGVSDSETGRGEQELLELSDLEQYRGTATPLAHQDYSFFPPGALTARKQVEKGRKLMVAAALFAGLLFLGAIPFIIQSIQFRSLAATLESQRVLSADARQDQAAVVNFENELGPLYDYPEQRVRDAMYTLQAVLSPTQLSSLEISKGIVRLQGSSSEPQAILQRLEGDPMFTEVAFSRATSNDRFFIDLRLSTVNFDAYMVRYFPD